MEELYDCVIVGAGPAGLTAAIYARRARLKIAVLEKSFVAGGQIADSSEVDNYPGLPGIAGADLGDAFLEHAKKFGVQTVREDIASVERDAQSGNFHICTARHTYQTKTVILASGARHRHLDIPGEEELSGMGVSYCATCDGAFFRDRTVAVVGGGNSAVEDAVFLSRICRKVYVIHRRDELRGDKSAQEALFARENVEILWDTLPVRIQGEDQVEGIAVLNKKTGKERLLMVDGVFVAVGMVPNTEFLRGFMELDKGGYIKAGEDGITAVPGVFAAGDVRTKKLRQVVTAVSDGANAVYSAEEYLLKKG